MLTLTDEEIENRTENAELFVKAIDLVIKECEGKINVMEMSDCLLAIGFDMLYHIVSHSMPDATPEKLGEAVGVHIDEIKTHLEENVWKAR